LNVGNGGIARVFLAFPTGGGGGGGAGSGGPFQTGGDPRCGLPMERFRLLLVVDSSSRCRLSGDTRRAGKCNSKGAAMSRKTCRVVEQMSVSEYKVKTNMAGMEDEGVSRI
jgi:hypothetical protein